MASIKEVAKRAGVSIATVSNVLNNTKFVSHDLRIKVNIAVQELGYAADPIASQMKTKQTKTIGVITADMCGLFYPYVVKGIYEIINSKGYSIIISDTNSINDRMGSFEREMISFKKLISSRVDGIIFASTVAESVEQGYLKEMKKLANAHKKIALLSIERDFSKCGIDSVFSDSVAGAQKATNHLIELGCKRIGHITGPIYAKVAQDRLLGYKNAMEAAGFQVDEDKMVANGDYTHQSGYIALKELLILMPDMDGVYVANDQMAVGVIKALSEFNKKVPEDIKVIGYDNVFIASIIEPSLSTIHIRKRGIGIEAARILLERIENPDSDQGTAAIEMETRLVVRKSTVSNAPEDWILSDW